jgi:spore coat protein U-like protein
MVNIDSEGTITLNCTCSNPPCDRQAKVTVAIGPSNISGSVNPREMKRIGFTETLQYQLYQDAARTNIWDTSPPRNVKDGTPFVMTIYGQIPYYAARTLLPTGPYSDGAVFSSGPTVTINW